MTDIVDQFKARTAEDDKRVVEKIRAVAAAGGNSMAQLIIALEALGVDGRDALAAVTGKSVRMIQKTAKQIRELECANPSAQRTPVCEPECASTNPGAHSEPRFANPSARREPECASHARGVVPNPTTVEVVEPKTPTTHTPSPSFKVSPSPLPPSPGAKVCKRGARLPDDWKLPVDWQQWARVNFPSTSAEAVTLEADKFRDFWCSKAGQGATKLDWQATWRNWCRTAFAAKPGRQPVNNGRSAYDERMARQRAQIAEARALIAARGARDAAHH